MGSFFGILFFSALGRSVSEFVRHPVTQPVIAPTTVGIDVYAATGEVSEHLVGHTCGDMKAVQPGSVEELPVRHKDDAAGKDFGLHYLNLGVAVFPVAAWFPGSRSKEEEAFSESSTESLRSAGSL